MLKWKHIFSFKQIAFESTYFCLFDSVEFKIMLLLKKQLKKLRYIDAIVVKSLIFIKGNEGFLWRV